MLLDDPKAVKKFITRLNNYNSLMKNVKETTSYIVVKGVFFTFPDKDSKDLGACKLTPVKDTKKDSIDEYLFSLMGVINGAELYSFLKENKKTVTSVEFSKTSFTINAEGCKFESQPLTKEQYDFKEYKVFTSKLKTKGITLIDQLDIEGELKDEILKATFPSMEIGNINVRISRNQFIKFSDKLINKAQLYAYEGNVVLLILQTEDPKLFMCEQRYLVLLSD